MEYRTEQLGLGKSAWMDRIKKNKEMKGVPFHKTYVIITPLEFYFKCKEEMKENPKFAAPCPICYTEGYENEEGDPLYEGTFTEACRLQKSVLENP